MGVGMINLVLTVENFSAVLAVEISWAFLHVPKVGTEGGAGRSSELNLNIKISRHGRSLQISRSS